MRIIATTLVAASLLGCAAPDEPEVKAPEALEESEASTALATENPPEKIEKNAPETLRAETLEAEAAPPFQFKHFEAATHSVAAFDMAPFELTEEPPQQIAAIETSTDERISPEDDAFATLSIDDAMIALLKERETLQLRSYRGPSGAWLVGYGHKRTARGGMEISEAEAEALLRRDLAETEAAVKRALKQPITRHEYSAMVGLAYNIGVGAFARSSVLRAFNDGDREAAANAFLAWNKTTVNGQRKELTHLTERRERERAHFLRGAG